MRLFFILFLIAGSASASSDPLIARLADPLEEGSRALLSLGMRQYQREFWLDDQMQATYISGSSTAHKGLKGFRFEADGLLKVSPRNILELRLPYYFQEFSWVYDGYTPPAALDDANVSRGDGLGDLSLAWRALVLTTPHWSGGFSIEGTAPTGLGPYSSPTPLVATGQGNFGGALALNLRGAVRSISAWAEGRVILDFGSNVTTAGREVFVHRDRGFDLNAGLGWVWAESQAYQHSLVIEMSRATRGSWIVDGHPLAYSATTSLDLYPQMRFSYVRGFTFTLGWQLPLWLATNQAVSYWGEPMLRADYPL
jgi:hypothetical protein